MAEVHRTLHRLGDPGRVEFRAAEADDFGAIAQLLSSREELFLVHPAGQYPFSVEQLVELSHTRKELTVAVCDGAVVGFANLYDIEPGRWGFIGNIVVSRTCRGRGLGRMLVKHMIQVGSDKYRLAQIRISVFSENVPALLLYTDLGFEPYAVDERRGPEGERRALVHMKLPDRIT